MSKFIFENEEGEFLDSLSRDNFEQVVNCWLYSNTGKCGQLQRKRTELNDKWANEEDGVELRLIGIYRVLAKPYTLDDAKQDICKEAASRKPNSNSLDPEHKVGAKFAMDIIDKLAASMEGDK